MPDSDTDQEHSIEEILTSIRQIISDEDEDGDSVVEEEGGVEEDEDDVVELKDKIDDDAAEVVEEVEAVYEPESDLEPEPEIEEIEVEMQDSRPEPVREVEPEDDFDSILTSGAEDAAYGAFSELAKKSAIQTGGITVEEIVRSELKPLLRSWLDRNLPKIIERLVQEELDRVAKRALED